MLGKLFLRRLRQPAIAENFSAVSVDPANPSTVSPESSSPVPVDVDELDPANNPFDAITATSTDEELDLAAEEKALPRQFKVGSAFHNDL
jgi:hypothetical protein